MAHDGLVNSKENKTWRKTVSATLYPQVPHVQTLGCQGDYCQLRREEVLLLLLVHTWLFYTSLMFAIVHVMGVIWRLWS
jgi:hypothetical protein